MTVAPLGFQDRCFVLGRAPLGIGLFLILTAGLSTVAAAQPRGDFRLWIEERVERWGPYGVIRNWEGSKVHGEGQFFPINAGSWMFSMDASERGQELRFVGNEIPTGVGRLAIQMGDYMLHDPRDDSVRLEFQPAQWLRGAAVRLEREKVTLGARAGVQTQRDGRFGWGRQPVFGETYGLTASGNWLDKGLWKVDWDRQQAVPDTRQGLQLLRFFLCNQPAAGWSWLSQMRLSRQDVAGRWGNSLIGGGRYITPRFFGQVHLRRLSPSFESLGIYSSPHANEWGWRMEAVYRPPSRVRVGTSWDWAKDVIPRPGVPGKEKRLISRFYVSSPLGDQFAVTANVGFRNRSTHDPDSLLVDQGTLSWTGTFSWSGKSARADLDVHRSLFRDPTQQNADWHETRYGTRLQKQLTQELRGELNVWLADRRFLDGRWASRERKLETRMYWIPRPDKRVWLRVARDHQNAAQALFRRDQWELGAGWIQPLPWNLTFQLESLFFVGVSDAVSDRSRWNFRLSRQFVFGAGKLHSLEALPEFGTIEGVVYEDLNSNGFRDEGEAGISGVVMRLGSGDQTITDERGHYGFDRAYTAVETVTLDQARLPTRYLAPEKERFTVVLGPGERQTLNYGIRPAAAMFGRVMLDKGHKAEGVPDVLIRVLDTHHDAFTDAEGRFYIPDLNAGPVTIEVIEWSLPENSRPQGSLTKTVVLKPGKPVNAGVIVLDHVEPKILQIFRPN